MSKLFCDVCVVLVPQESRLQEKLSRLETDFSATYGSLSELETEKQQSDEHIVEQLNQIAALQVRAQRHGRLYFVNLYQNLSFSDIIFSAKDFIKKSVSFRRLK